MAIIAQIGLYILALILLLAGFSHFAKERFYARMLPLWMPAHKFLVAATGALELLLGLALLFEKTRTVGAWGTVVMLTVYLIIHIHMLFDKEAGMGLPKWALGLRLAFQLLLILWTYSYT